MTSLGMVGTASIAWPVRAFTRPTHICAEVRPLESAVISKVVMKFSHDDTPSYVALSFSCLKVAVVGQTYDVAAVHGECWRLPEGSGTVDGCAVCKDLRGSEG